MAKTLLFLEALALAALSLVLPLIASRTAEAFILPFALSLILPLACVLSVWPAKEVRAALLLLFSAGEGEGVSQETAAILEALGAFSRSVAASGFLISLAIAATRLPLKGDTPAWSWLGLYLSLYALVNATLWQALTALAKRLPRPAARDPSNPEVAAGRFGRAAERYGLSPREWEAARLIAGGRSYKETAAELGISIKTVKSHMGRVYEKTGAASNVALSLLLRSAEAESADIIQRSDSAAMPSRR